MDDDVATGAIGSVIAKLAELRLQPEYDELPPGDKERVESLALELQRAHAFLQAAGEVPPDQLDGRVEAWTGEVREASFAVEDVILALADEDPDPPAVQAGSRSKLERLEERIGVLLGKAAAHRDIIAAAVEEADGKKLMEIDPQAAATPSPGVHGGTTGNDAPLLVGVDEAKDAVVKMLSDESTGAVSILGVGGVGKTTLAKAAYEQLRRGYECGVFVPVGRDPDLMKVYRDILLGLDRYKFYMNITRRSEDSLIRQLREYLPDKRYLIVIDDVWEIQSRDRIIKALPKNNVGGRIIITTRNSQVASHEVYQLQPLSEDNSKRLFYTRIFGGEDKCPNIHKVSEVAHRILRKCGGVPLAIITMASLLVGKSMEKWLEVCNSISFRDKDKEQLDDTMWILSLSYYDLPSHLKACLLCLSVFPEDYLIKKHTLIWMWVAEGFVNGEPGAGLFEVGEVYFNDLVNRSLIQPVKGTKNRDIKGCRVHDMILDLIRSLSREAKFSMVLDHREGPSLGSYACRLALQRRVQDVPLNNHTDPARTRSFLAFMCRFGPEVKLQSYKHLRVLYLEDCSHIPFFEHIGDLPHLRYLKTSRQYGLKLPEEERALKFLQVLDLDKNDTGLPNHLLPSWVCNLTQLVCLRAWHHSLPGGQIKNLTSLQDLHIFPDWLGDEESRGQFVKDLGNLRELRALRLRTGFDDRRMQSDFIKSLGNLHKLQRLDLDGETYYFNTDGTVTKTNEWQLELPLPPGLHRLTLSSIPELLPCIHSSCLPNLSHLSLKVSHQLGDQGLKTLGELPELRYLKLSLGQDTRRRKATVTGTSSHVYFKKLRSCLLPDSLAQFVVNEEDSSISFTMWGKWSDPPPSFGSEMNQVNSRRVARAVMPNLEFLFFHVDAKTLMECNNGSFDNLGLDCLASLEVVRVFFECWRAPAAAVEKEKAALRRAIQVHPNRPKLEIAVDY